MAENEKKADKSKAKKTSFWTGVKREWRKIIWIPREEVFKKTGLVIAISLAMGVIITVVDSGAQYLVEWLMSI